MNERMINMFSAKGESLVRNRTAANKKILRGRCKEIREGLTEDYLTEGSRLIAEQVLASEEYRSAETVFVYRSMREEPATDALIAQALADGKTVCVPLCLPETRMDAKRIAQDSEWRSGPFGILEPLPEAETVPPEEIDLAIVPCVACDARGNRLGHGAGYYDRYLTGTRCFKMALCFDRLILGNIQTDREDVRMDAVITETQIYRR